MYVCLWLPFGGLVRLRFFGASSWAWRVCLRRRRCEYNYVYVWMWCCRFPISWVSAEALVANTSSWTPFQPYFVVAYFSRAFWRFRNSIRLNSRWSQKLICFPLLFCMLIMKIWRKIELQYKNHGPLGWSRNWCFEYSCRLRGCYSWLHATWLGEEFDPSSTSCCHVIIPIQCGHINARNCRSCSPCIRITNEPIRCSLS